MTFNYFYGTEADQFSFYRIPKALFTDSYFKDLSSDAKILYGLMLDRMSLSIKNQWFDDKNRAYIYFSIEDMSGNTTKVKNIKKYLLAALFNAPSTMNGYYQAEVNHDMPGLVR